MHVDNNSLNKFFFLTQFLQKIFCGKNLQPAFVFKNHLTESPQVPNETKNSSYVFCAFTFIANTLTVSINTDFFILFNFNSIVKYGLLQSGVNFTRRKTILSINTLAKNQHSKPDI